MQFHNEMIKFHVENQDEINIDAFESKEEFVLHLIHTFAYTQSSKLVKDKVVLDIGCNVGYGSDILSRSARKVIGVDVSEKVILSAKNRFTCENIEFQHIDGKTLPFGNDRFDVIISCQVIEHIVDYDQFIGEILRVLKPDGVVVFTTPNACIRLDPGMEPWYEFHVKEFMSSELDVLLRDYFSHVSVCGLFAEEPIFSIELQRVTYLRENARGGERTVGLKQKIKAILPDWVLKSIAGARRLISIRLGGIDSHSFDEKFIGKVRSKKLDYRASGVDSSLDLLAICSNSNASIEKCRQSLL
ncbi:MAG: methyltransferase domain-containing protein [Mariprofundus sp.]|nr:methyltransferase domain-containing protein [Mariprofundus sp.]